MAHRVFQYFFSSRTRRLLILLFAVLITFFAYSHLRGVPVNIDTLVLNVRHTPITELFFINYLALPTTIQAGQTVPINFTIRNAEGRDKQYDYLVYLITTGGRRIPVTDGSVEVADSSEASVHTSYTFRSHSLPVTFFVELPASGQHISAIVPVPTL